MSNRRLIDAVAQLSAELGFVRIGRTVDVQMHPDDFAKAFPERTTETSMFIHTGAGPSVTFTATQERNEDKARREGFLQGL